LIKNKEIVKLDSFLNPKQKLYSKLELKKAYSNMSFSLDLYVTYLEFNPNKGDSNKYISPIKNKHKLNPNGIIGKKTYHILIYNKDSYIKTLKA